jgi:AAA domain/Domain of unknown function (DUF3854)
MNIPNLRGTPLLPGDLDKLAKCGIPRELAESAMLRRVDSTEGASIVGRNGNADYSGILFPYTWPGEERVRDYRLRRDRPELEQKADGGFSERNKYISPPGRGNMLYTVPGTDAAWPEDFALPVFLIEGEKKCLALHGLSWHGLGDGAERPRWLSIGVSGVWNFRGSIGKAPGPDGDRRDVKGVIPDIERIIWKRRKVTIVFDRNVSDNDSVRAARFTLTTELRKRGAEVFWFEWPRDVPAGVNGIDDLIGVLGADAVLDLLRKQTQKAKQHGTDRKPLAEVIGVSFRSMEDVMSDSSIRTPELLVDGLVPKGGLVLLGGRPKDGKSWFACQLGLAVVTGDSLGGWLSVKEQSRVQLWALEDQAAITKDKIGKLLGGARPDGLRDLLLYEQLPKPILAGGDQILHDALTKQPAGLIILDSLFKLTGSGGQRNRDIQQGDYDVIDRVRKIVLEHNCSAVIVMHTKKGARGGNPIENLIGTSGISAAADAAAELKRTSAREGKLTVVGRLVQPEDYSMIWHAGDEADWGWSIDGTGDDASIGETMSEVIAYLQAQGPTKPATIASALRRTFGSVWQALLRLESRGKAAKGRDKKWEITR